MSERAVVIDVEGLTKSFGGPPVVRNVRMQVEQGRIYGFLGPNGSGKTTTIRLLCGLLTPDSGQGTCLGFDILRESRRIKERVGYMTQRFSLYGDLTVRENLEFVARVYSVTDCRRAVDQTLERLGLTPWSDHIVDKLSGGWKQRLALGACMMHKPQLLLLDEPTAGVDPKARRDFWTEIHDLSNAGITVLVSTHYMDEAERCHELAYMFEGEILDRGPVDDVTARAGLVTWIVSGRDLVALEADLLKEPAIDIVTPFADTLRVSGHNPNLIDKAVKSYQADKRYKWRRGEPKLEDVFIWMMKRREAQVGGE